MQRSSISLRLSLWYAAMLLSGLALLAGTMRFELERSMLAWKDRTMAMRAARIEKLLAEAENGSARQRTERLDNLLSLLPEGHLIEIVSSDGAVVYPAERLAERDRISRVPCASPETRSLSRGNDRYRRYCAPVVMARAPASLIVASPLLEDRMLLRTFDSALLRLLPVLLAIPALGGYLLSRRALSPVDRLISEARTITARDLSRRLAVPEGRDELHRLATTLNDLLGRLEQGVQQIRQFTADASHELRSPLAYIAATAEFHRTSSTADSHSREGFLEIEAEARSVGILLGNLLELARLDAHLPDRGNSTGEESRTEIDPYLLLGAVMRQVTQQAIAKRIRLTIDHPPVQPLRSNLTFAEQSAIRRILIVFADNAIKYTPAGGNVHLGWSLTEGLSFQVVDDGIGIGADSLGHIFQRFFQVERARSEGECGSGLGLAIAKELADSIRATITARSDPGVGSHFSLHLAWLHASASPSGEGAFSANRLSN